MDFSTIEITLKKYVDTTWVFRPSKLHRKKYVETTWRIFQPLKLHRKGTWKQRGFFDHRNDVEKSIWKQREFFEHRNYFEKSMWKALFQSAHL